MSTTRNNPETIAGKTEAIAHAEPAAGKTEAVTIRILILEDSLSDSDLIQRLLKKEIPGCECSLAMDKESFLKTLDEFNPDIILSDNSLPQFNSSEALRLSREKRSHIPFILVTGTVSEEFAAEIIKLGADDYILKDRMTRLPAAIEAVLKQKKSEMERLQNEDNIRQLEKELSEQQILEQKKIIKAIIIAQDQERNHIGRELHDNINQILAAAKMHLGIIGYENENLRELIAYPAKLIESSIQEIRLLCQKLVSPVRNIDLEEMVRELLTLLNQQAAMNTDFFYVVDPELLKDELKLNIYRILQEQINNIIKYSQAKNVSVALNTQDNTLYLTVTDDGIGYDSEKKRTGIGISNIINRIESFNGRITIKSSPGKGCSIKISIPF